MQPRTWGWSRQVGVSFFAGLLGVAAFFGLKELSSQWLTRHLPVAESSVLVVRPTADVLMSIRELARLESASFHLERVVDITDEQSRLFGVLHTKDSLVLVAAADVVAGVDLAKLTPDDVVVDAEHRTAKVQLPAAEIFATNLDAERTFVHARQTGLLAKRNEELETNARREATRTLTEAARQGGILQRAQTSAARTIETLVRSLGYEHVEVQARDGA